MAGKTYKNFKDCFDDNFTKTYKVGVIEREELYASDYGKTKSFYKGVANSQKKTLYKDKDGNTVTTADSFVSVNEKTKFVEAFKQKYKDKIVRVLSLITKNGKEKAILNGLSNVMKESYNDCASKFHNNPDYAHVKGFDRYAVGTGQTLQSIKAQEEKNE